MTPEDGATPPMGEAAAEEAPRKQAKRGALARAGRFVGGLIVTAAVAGAVFVGVMAAQQTLQQRAADAPTPPPTPPLAVQTIQLERQEGYDAVERYAGRLEAARQTVLAFERAGRVAEVRVEEGDRVAADALIARLDVARLEAERARLDAEKTRLEAQLLLAQRTVERQRRLANRQFASEQALDEAVANEAGLAASIASIDAQRAALEVDIDDALLTAPFDGLIASRSVDPGAFTGPGAPVAEILEVGRPQARIGLSPEQAERLREGDVYPIEINGRMAEGRLVALRPDIAPTTRTVPALFDVTMTGGARPPAFGEVARIGLTRRIEEPGAWVPLSALQEGLRGLWTVYVAVPAGEDEGWRIGQEAVEIIHIADGRAYVRTALPDGARIVAAGVNRITRGQRVQPIDLREPGSSAGGRLSLRAASAVREAGE